jgi:hypothetical protein
MPSGTRAELALSEWRRAERELRAVDSLADEAAGLADEVELRRAQYHAIAGKSGASGPLVDADGSGRTSTFAVKGRDFLRERLMGDGLWGGGGRWVGERMGGFRVRAGQPGLLVTRS